MQETLNDHHTFISIGGRPICNLRFVDDIDLMDGSNGELQDLTNRLVDRATACEMEVSNSTNNISAYISMNGRSPHQDCLSNAQTKRDLAVQYHQLCKHVQKLYKSLVVSTPL